MRRAVAWLHAELPELVERGILTPDAADALRRHYGPAHDDAQGRWSHLVLAAVGALSVGGGLILILAHNWDAFGRPARAAIALGLLLTAQALAVFAVLRREGSPPWIEGTSAFLVAAVGAAIALIGQTYHAGGSFEGLMQAWLWLVVAVPYLTGSALASVGFWALLLVRMTSVPWWTAPNDVWPLALAGVPFVVLRVRRAPASWATALVTVAAAVSLFVVGSSMVMGPGWRGLWAVFQVSLLAFLVAASRWPGQGRGAAVWGDRVFVPAWLTLIAVATLLSFEDVWRPIDSLSVEPRRALQVWLTAAVALCCAAVATYGAMRLLEVRRHADALAASAGLLVVLTHLAAMVGAEWAGWVAFNLWLFGLGSLTVLEGVRGLQLTTANRGLLALAVLAIARFFDTDLSFLVRGLAFITLGAACLALNLWLMRRVRGGRR